MPAHARGSQESLRPYTLARIEFRGLRRVSRAQALGITGLRPGTTVTSRDLQAAATRLLDSGLFSAVRSVPRMDGYSLVVAFVVEEAAWTTPVVFDNFVGFSDEALRAVVSARFPLFDGGVPAQPAVLGRVASALQQFVRTTMPAATVVFVSAGDSDRSLRYRFRIELPGRTFPVCRVQVAGVPDEVRAEAERRARSLVGTDYSRDFASDFATRTLAAAAQGGGHYRARVRSVVAVPSSGDGSCAGGADVTVTLDQGRVYTWSAVEWVNLAPSEAEEMSRLVPIAPGDSADAARMGDLVTAARQWFRRRGYLAATVQPTTLVDDAAGTLACQLVTSRGVRYRFRSLQLIGLEAPLAERIRARWQLAAGDFYDAGYTQRFVSEIRDAERAALAGRTTITTRERPDTGAPQVDVVLEFSR
jgi:outer membrane protein assembly factor BamA